MTRWAPDPRERLQAAALQLFESKGFDDVTAKEIALAAGLSERTFFRHFETKHEVLFAEGPILLGAILDAMDAAPSTASPHAVLTTVCRRLAAMFEPRRAYLRERATVISREPALRQREALKDHEWAGVIAANLGRRGVNDARAAALAAATTAMFRVVYNGWTTDRAATTLTTRLERALEDLGLTVD